MVFASLASFACLAALASQASSTPLSTRRTAIRGPLLSESMYHDDFADPGILFADGKWWAYASQSGQDTSATDYKDNGSGVGGGYSILQRVRVASSTNFMDWQPEVELAGNMFDNNNFPTYADKASTLNWAPEVFFNAKSGKYVMYWSYQVPGTNKHCIAVMTAPTPTGTFLPVYGEDGKQHELVCNLDVGGQIDAYPFYDAASDKHYLVYKDDTNSLGAGGSCGSPPSGQNTKLQIAPLNDEATAFYPLDTGVTTLLVNDPNTDGPIVEAPSLIQSKGIYYLFFSSNCYLTGYYDVSYATSSNLMGPYTKAADPLFTTDNFPVPGPTGSKVVGPGGAGVVIDPTDDSYAYLALSAHMPEEWQGVAQKADDPNPFPVWRNMWNVRLRLDNNIVSIADFPTDHSVY